MELYSFEDFATLRGKMRTLPHGQLLFIADRSLQPEQLRELDADDDFTVICARENHGAQLFYCIAHSSDTQLALGVVKNLIESEGGSDIESARIN